MNVVQGFVKNTKQNIKLIAIMAAISSTLIGCKPKKNETINPIIDSTISQNIPPKYNGHTYSGKEPFPIFMIEPEEFGTDIKNVGANDSTLISNFLNDGVLGNGNSTLSAMNYKGIKGLGSEPKILGTSIVNNQTFKNQIGGDKINDIIGARYSNYALKFCDNIVLPNFLKKIKQFYDKNGYYPLGGSVMVNIPISYYNGGPAGTILEYSKNVNGHNIKLEVIFQIQNYDKRPKEDNMTLKLNLLFHELMHKLTRGKFVADDNNKIDKYGHDNNLYIVKYKDGGETRSQIVRSPFNSSVGSIKDGTVMTMLLKDGNTQIMIFIPNTDPKYEKYIKEEDMISISREGGQPIYIDEIIKNANGLLASMQNAYRNTPKVDGKSLFPRENNAIASGRLPANDEGKVELICSDHK